MVVVGVVVGVAVAVGAAVAVGVAVAVAVGAAVAVVVVVGVGAAVVVGVAVAVAREVSVADEQEPVPDYTSVKGLKPLKRLVAERLSLHAEKKEREARIREIDESIMPLLMRAGLTKVMVDDEPVTMVEGSYPSFDKKKLVEIPFPCPHCRAKVTLPGEVVQKAITMKDRKPYIQCGRRSKEEEE